MSCPPDKPNLVLTFSLDSHPSRPVNMWLMLNCELEKTAQGLAARSSVFPGRLRGTKETFLVWACTSTMVVWGSAAANDRAACPGAYNTMSYGPPRHTTVGVRALTAESAVHAWQGLQDTFVMQCCCNGDGMFSAFSFSTSAQARDVTNKGNTGDVVAKSHATNDLSCIAVHSQP